MSKNQVSVRQPFRNWKSVRCYSDDGSRLEGMGGLYAIYVLDQLVYIGQTSNLKRRLREHGFLSPLLLCKDFFRQSSLALGIRVKVRGESDRSKRVKTESGLIRRLTPRVNGGPGFDYPTILSQKYGYIVEFL